MFITIIATISRPECLTTVYDNFTKLLLPEHQYDFLVMVDNKDIRKTAIEIRLEKYREEFDVQNIQIVNTGRPAPSPFDMDERRSRIAGNHTLLSNMVGDSEYVFCFEDDTVLPDMALSSLLWFAIELPDMGIMEGVQVGRWSKPYVGAWKVDDLENPTRYETVLPGKEKCTPIDAGGFYCFLVRTELYRSRVFTWKQPVGPDVMYGLELRRKGHRNYINWNVLCGHRTGETVLTFNDKSVRLSIEKQASKWVFSDG